MWRHPWLPNIITSLISDRNPERTLTNSDLEIVTLFLHEATLLETYPDATMAAPRLELDNTLTVSCSTWEASTINPAVADLLRICALHSGQFFLNPSVIYHPGLENCMEDDSSRLFHLSDTPFLAHMSVTYPQSHIL